MKQADMQSIVVDWKANAGRNVDRNYGFLRSLKERSGRGVDEAAREWHERAFSIFDCAKCANCCRVVQPLFRKADIKRVAARLGLRRGALTDMYLIVSDPPSSGWVPKSLPCPFLGPDDRCTIYEVRPRACAEYPHTQKRGFSRRTRLHAGNSLDCPAVFYIVQNLRRFGI